MGRLLDFTAGTEGTGRVTLSLSEVQGLVQSHTARSRDTLCTGSQESWSWTTPPVPQTIILIFPANLHSGRCCPLWSPWQPVSQGPPPGRAARAPEGLRSPERAQCGHSQPPQTSSVYQPCCSEHSEIFQNRKIRPKSCPQTANQC